MVVALQTSAKWRFFI